MGTLVRDKHSSLLQNFVNYVRKMFYNIGTRYRIHNTAFFSKLTNGPDKLKCLSLESLFSLVYNNSSLLDPFGRKWSVVNTLDDDLTFSDKFCEYYLRRKIHPNYLEKYAVCTTLHFHHNLWMGPISYRVCHWQAFLTKCSLTL